MLVYWVRPWRWRYGRDTIAGTGGALSLVGSDGRITARKYEWLALLRPALRSSLISVNNQYMPKGLTGWPSLRTSKCRCGPVERPVEPILAIASPLATAWPSLA